MDWVADIRGIYTLAKPGSPGPWATRSAGKATRSSICGCHASSKNFPLPRVMGGIPKFMGSLVKTDLLILDDWRRLCGYTLPDTRRHGNDAADEGCAMRQPPTQKYPTALKERAVKLAVESEQSIAQTARDLGVNANTRHTCGRQHARSVIWLEQMGCGQRLPQSWGLPRQPGRRMREASGHWRALTKSPACRHKPPGKSSGRRRRRATKPSTCAKISSQSASNIARQPPATINAPKLVWPLSIWSRPSSGFIDNTP